jgi:hypothetical protein
MVMIKIKEKHSVFNANFLPNISNGYLVLGSLGEKY